MENIINVLKERKWLSVILGLMLFMIVTNPSPNNFREYMGWDKKHSAKREWNFFICSIYRGENYNTYKRSVDWWGRPIVNKCYATLHLGIAGNFFIVKYREEGCQTNLEPTIY